jgi:hypothetical protein
MDELNYYNIDRVNFSSLKWFNESPLYYRKMKLKEIEEPEKVWQQLGKQLHMLILQPDEFQKNYLYLEFDTPQSQNQRKFCEELIKTNDKIAAYKANYSTDKKSDKKIEAEATTLEEQLSSYIEYLKKHKVYKSILSKDTFEYLQKAKDAVLNHKVAKQLVLTPDEDLLDPDKEYHNEFPIYWDLTRLDLQCKSLLDRIIIDHKNKSITLVDLKTTSNLKEFKDKLREYNYHQQMAFYWLAIYWYFREVLKKDNIEEYSHNTYLIAISKGEVVECKVFALHDNIMFGAFKEVTETLEKLSYHIKNDLWDFPQSYYENDGIEHIYT